MDLPNLLHQLGMPPVSATQTPLLWPMLSRRSFPVLFLSLPPLIILDLHFMPSSPILSRRSQRPGALSLVFVVTVLPQIPT